MILIKDFKLLVLILVHSAFLASSQNVELISNTLNSGSETATSTSFQLNGAVGEISSGPSISTSFVLNSGSLSNRVLLAADPPMLVAHYPFDGNLDDVSGNMYAAAYDGAQIYDYNVAGFPDKAFYFDGSTKVAHTFIDPINFKNFTLSVWVYIENPSSTELQHVIGLESSTDIFQVGDQDRQFLFWDETTNNDLGTVTFGPVTEGWHHLVVTWDGVTVDGYLDGTANNYADILAPLDFKVEEINIGENIAYGENLTGIVDEVKVFNYALSFDEIQDLHNSYPPPPTAPVNVVAKVIGPGAIQLTWDDGSDETYYEVFWEDPDLQSDFVDLAQDETTYTITGLSTNFEYYIEVVAWNDYDQSAATSTLLTPVDNGPIQAQAIPGYFTLDETTIIQYFPTLSYPDSEMDTATTIFMHAGLIAPGNEETGDWSDTLKVEMIPNGGVWEATITPRTDFGISNDFVASQMAMFFTNADSSAYGYAANLEDIKLQIFDPTTITPIGGFLDTDATTDVFLDDATADASGGNSTNIKLGNRSEYTIEALINFGDMNPGIGTFTDLITRGFDDGSSYTNYHGFVYYELDGTTAYPTGVVSTDISGSTNHYLNTPLGGVDVTGKPGGDAYSNGTWAHIAMVYTTPSSGNMDLYINGIYQGFVEIFELPLVGNTLRIGQFTGGVDELRFWDDVRTQEQIRTNLKSEIDPTAEGLIGYWKMNGIINDGTNDVIPDETTSGNNLIAQSVVVQQSPDLDIITQTLNPGNIAPGENLSISYTIQNIDLGDAAAFSLDFYLSSDNVFNVGDIPLGNVDFGSGLANGESFSDVAQVQIPGATANGIYYLISVLDSLNEVTETNEANNTFVSVLGVNTANTNNVTTSITLDNYSFEENAAIGTVVGAISYDDPDNDLFDIALVSGTGDTDNGLFQISGGELITGVVRDFEVDNSSYSVRIQVDDNRGGVYEEAININLTDVNEAPTAIMLDNTFIIQSLVYFDDVVGTLSTEDPDNNEVFTYTIIDDNNSTVTFDVSGSNLLITGSSTLNDNFFVTIQSTDQGGLTTSQEFTITVGAAPEAPSGLLLSNNTINENHGPGAAIGKFFTTDDDSDTHTYSFAGGTDDASFGLTASGDLSQAAELAVGSYSIRVTTTDEADLTFTRTFTINVIANEVGGGVISIGGDINNYRIIGVPFTSTSVSNIFGDLSNEGKGSEWRILSFNNGSTSDLSLSSNLTGGNGYWFISTKSLTVQLPAANLNTNATVSKSLSAGWNAVGNPFLNALNWNTVKSFNEGLGTISSGDVGDIFTWNGSWNTTTQLGVMQGGYVKATNASSGFAIPASTASVGSARTSASNRMSTSYLENSSEWQLMFLLESKGISSNISGVGVNPSSIEGMDALDIDPPPTPSVFDPLQLTERATGLTKNLKEASKSIMWDFALTRTGEETTLSWNQTIASQLDEPLMIALLPQGELFDMSEMGSITFNPEKNQSVMVIYGDELPKELLYNAITAYPNPADQEVSFRFYVDGEGMIPASVELYNLGGQRLGAINQNVNGGHWAEIQYQIGTEEILKSGIYLFKVRYNDFESVVKKLIVK